MYDNSDDLFVRFIFSSAVIAITLTLFFFPLGVLLLLPVMFLLIKEFWWSEIDHYVSGSVIKAENKSEPRYGISDSVIKAENKSERMYRICCVKTAQAGKYYCNCGLSISPEEISKIKE